MVAVVFLLTNGSNPNERKFLSALCFETPSSILTYSRKEWVRVLNLRDDLEPYAERVLMLVPVGAEHFETAYLSR